VPFPISTSSLNPLHKAPYRYSPAFPTELNSAIFAATTSLAACIGLTNRELALFQFLLQRHEERLIHVAGDIILPTA